MKHTSIIVAVGLAFAATLPAVPAQAQLQHTFVSSQGLDTNNCSLATPCRHLQAALSQTTAGGEIAILDSAGYNGGTTVTIMQAVSIVAPLGIEAELAPPSGGTAIVISAPATDVVSLRGLTIDGGGVGNTGIQFNTGKSLTIENCIIRHVGGTGLIFIPNASSNLSVSNSLVADNNLYGIYVLPSGSVTVTVVVNHVEVNNHGITGITVDGRNSTGMVNATVSDSVAAGNIIAGFYSITASGQAPTTLMVVRSVAANNGYGLYADGTGATLRVANSTVMGNTNGWLVASSGIVNSYGNNSIDGNTTNETAPPSIALK